MSESYCEICNGILNSNINVLRISDDRTYCEFMGHHQCVQELEQKVKSLDYKKLSVEKIIKQLNLQSILRR